MNRKINNKSDFDFILNLTDSDGNSVGWIDANWLLTLYTTSKTFKYEAAHAFGDKINCRNDDGQILILVDNHEFPIGELLMDFEIDIPDPRYPDGNHHVTVTGEKTGIELVLDRGQEVTGLAINLRVPHIKKAETAATPDSGTSAGCTCGNPDCPGSNSTDTSDKDDTSDTEDETSGE